MLLQLEGFDPARLLAVLSACLFTLYLTSSVIAWYRLRHIPGPFLAKFSYFWMGKVSLRGEQYKTHLDLSKRYGPLVRVGPNDVITDDPEVLRRASNTKSIYKKAPAYTGTRFNPYHDPMFIILDPIKHDRVKAKLAPAYSGRDASSLESDIDEQIQNLIQLIHRNYVSQAGELRPLLMSKIAGLFTLDVISRISLGKEFGCLSSDSDLHGFYDALGEHLPQLALTTEVPWLRRLVYSPACLKLFGPKERDVKGIGKLMNLANAVVRDRFNSDVEKHDMLNSFLRHGLSQQECETETLFMFIAGSDTTAAAIRVTMLHIASAPQVYHRLKCEIEAAVREGRVSSPIANVESKRLPYLQAVIYEGLRIRPVTTNMLFKEVPPEGETIQGKFIPGGTALGVNFSSLLFSKEMFGEDAHIFRPERYLEVDEETGNKMKRNVELTFGYGRWMCAGKAIALLELNKVFFELLRVFDFQLVEPQRPMESISAILFRDKGPLLRVTLSEPREKAN